MIKRNRGCSMKGDKTQVMHHRRLFPLKDAAVYIGCSPWAVRDKLWAGELPYIKIGGKYFLDVADIDKWIEKSKTRFTY
jgi:excisionase family DNA binding protein